MGLGYESIPAPGLVADAILLLHAAIVAFVVFGQVLFMLGGRLGWAWVRRFWLRLTHLGLIGFVVLQAWLGALCPLTIWEQGLRRAAGQSAYEISLIEHWVGRLLFYDLPMWVFALIYTLFGLIVAWTWWRYPPRRK